MSGSGKWLVITEKPSVAGDIAKAIGGFEKKSDYYESDSYYMTWAVGHLVELLSPEDLDPKYKRWLLQDLPILPDRFEYKPKDGQKERLDVIKTLANKAAVVGLINACDAGREGELIFRELYDYSGVKKPMRRLWLQSMTHDAIRKEFKSLREGKDFDHLGDAARCRAESDWLIGMNATRAVTRRLKPKAQKGVSWSVGRVQTPTLALIVRRENEILKHRPEPFWTIEGRFSTDTHEYSGQWFDPNFKKAVADEEDAAIREKEDRIFSKQQLEKILAELNANKSVATASEIRKESKEIAPQMFDLTTLQREANRRFGMPASRTLQAAQRLYEKHKILTYPRTDSKNLPEDYVENVLGILKKYGDSKLDVAGVSRRILSRGLLNKDRVFNNKGISDHFAIIPTGEVPASALEGDDQRIFDLVSKRFLAAFMPPAVWAKVERITKISSQHFRTRVSDLQEQGWREVYGKDTEDESSLPKLDAKNPQATVAVKTEELQSQEAATKPPPRLSEAKLLSLMEHCGRTVEDENLADALQDKGIGTPATRADIIENLIGKEYVARSGKALRATSKGMRLLDVLNRVPVDGLASVELTGEMEFSLKQMERGAKSRRDFMKEMADYTREIVEKTRSFDYEALYATEPALGSCPACKKGTVYESFWGYKCNQKDDCNFIIWKEKNQRYMDRSLIHDILSHKTVGPVEFSTLSGTSYSSFLTVTEKGVVFSDENGQPMEALPGAEVKVLHEESLPETFLALPGRLIETENAYMCEFGVQGEPAVGSEEAQANKKPTRKKSTKTPTTARKTAAKKPKKLMARMPKTLCGHVVSRDEFKSFVITGMTPPITDFKSKKGRPFAASLHLKSNGNFEFKFESRKKLLGEDEKPKTRAKKPTTKAKVVKKTAKSESAAAE
ncbi:MAG: DNA topoisomerase III [Betaproteobacteria bacterium]|nr:DNA topoisomerase III [Betaproteobacteria bacterium]